MPVLTNTLCYDYRNGITSGVYMFLNKMHTALKQPCGWSRMVESDRMEGIPAWAGEPQINQWPEVEYQWC